MRVVLTVCVALLSGAASAAPPGAGLTLDPPPGWTVSPGQPSGNEVEALEISSPPRLGLTCEAGFQPLPGYARYRQSDLNAMTAEPAWIDRFRGLFSKDKTVASIEGFTRANLHGLRGIGDSRAADAKTPSLRVMMVIFDTPKGRTTLTCAGERADFDAHRANLDAISETLVVPQ